MEIFCETTKILCGAAQKCYLEKYEKINVNNVNSYLQLKNIDSEENVLIQSSLNKKTKMKNI